MQSYRPCFSTAFMAGTSGSGPATTLSRLAALPGGRTTAYISEVATNILP